MPRNLTWQATSLSYININSSLNNLVITPLKIKKPQHSRYQSHRLPISVSSKWEKNMGLERYLLPISILCFCCNTCYRNPLEGRLSNCVDEVLPHKEIAYPTYFGTINNEDHGFQSELTKAIGFKPINSRLRRLDNVGSSQTSTRVVNVDDFGAKGDGTDDTKVLINFKIIKTEKKKRLIAVV